MINELNFTNNPKNLFDQANDDIAAQNGIMQRVDAYCLNDTTCPFYSQGEGSVIKVCPIFPSKTAPQLTGFIRAFGELVAAVDSTTASASGSQCQVSSLDHPASLTYSEQFTAR